MQPRNTQRNPSWGTQHPASCYPMRSPWIGSLAFLAPARGFLVQHSAAAAVVGGGGAGCGGTGSAMLQAFVRPTGTVGAVRAIAGRRSTGGWRQHAEVGRQRAHVSDVRALSMGGGGGGGGAKQKKAKKPDSYYKNTVMLPQTAFEQVCVLVWCTDSMCPRRAVCDACGVMLVLLWSESGLAAGRPTLLQR